MTTKAIVGYRIDKGGRLVKIARRQAVSTKIRQRKSKSVRVVKPEPR